jgi:hypothetical protein
MTLEDERWDYGGKARLVTPSAFRPSLPSGVVLINFGLIHNGKIQNQTNKW